MIWLKQSTAKTLRFGPFLDEDDGKTAETGLTIGQADIRLSKNGGAFAQTNDGDGATHDEDGWYSLELDATDTNTLGPLMVAVHESGALPVWREFMVIPANIYDSLVSGSDYLQADAVQVEGSDATNQIRDAVVDDSTRIDASALNTLSSHDPGATLGTADAGDEMNLADDAITSAKFDESTAFPLKSADSGSTTVARTGADGDTLETLSDEIAAVQSTADAIETDTQDLQTQIGTAGAGLTAVPEVDADLKKINGNSVVGNAATLTLKQLDIRNSAGSAVIIKATAGNTHAVEIEGSGAGDGIISTGGLTGSGIHGVSGTSGSPNRGGIHADGGAGSSHGLLCIGGTTDGDGIKGEAGGSSNRHGLDVTGVGSGRGILAKGGVSGGAGIEAQSQGSNGDGLYALGNGSGKGINSAETDAILADTADMQPKMGTISDLGSGSTIGDNLSDIAGGTFSSATDSLEAIRDRGDAAWTTGAGTGQSVLATGTAQAGAAGTITLAAGESAVAEYYKGERVVITGGTGVGQSRIIIAYDESTKVASVAPSWRTNPDNTSTYEVQAADADMSSILEECVNGYNATLKLKQIDVQNSGGSAIIAQSTGSNGHGMQLISEGSGNGLDIDGGETGDGIHCVSGDSGGDGFHAEALYTGHGIYAKGQEGSGIVALGHDTGVSPMAGVQIQGGSTGAGVKITAGSTSGDGIDISATDGHGIDIAAGGNKNAIDADGAGTGHGIRVQGGNSGGDGLLAIGGDNGATSTAGAGIHAKNKTTNSGNTGNQGSAILAESDAQTGAGIVASASGSSNSGFNCYSSTQAGIRTEGRWGINVIANNYEGIKVTGNLDAVKLVAGTNKSGLALEGNGTGDGITATGGVTGKDINASEIGTPSDLAGSGASLAGNATDIYNAVSGLTIPSVADIADGVWDEAQADHIGAGTVGETLNTAGAGGDPSAIADAVWDEAIADHSGTAGSTAEALSGASAPTVGQIADAVWDEAVAGHVTGGSFGKQVQDILTDTGTTIPATLATLPTYVNIKGLLYKKTVNTRHDNDKPATITVGNAGDTITVTTTQDADGNTETESYA